MARAAAAALAFCLLLALAAAAPSAEFSQSEEEPVAEESVEESIAEEQRTGQEAQPQSLNDEEWQGEDADAAVSIEDEQGDDAVQGEYERRDNAEQQVQQDQNTQQLVQETDEGTLSRLDSEPLRQQQQSGRLIQQQTGQLNEQQTGQLNDQQTGQLNQQQFGQLNEQQTGQLNQQQTGQLNDQQGRLEDRPQPGDNPPRRQPGDKPPNNDFGIVSNDDGSLRPPQPGSIGVTPYRPPSPPGGSQSPPAGYVPLGSFGHFKVFVTPLTWPEALMTCIADGALLAVPNSEREAVAVGQFYGKVKNLATKSQDKELFFIGASDLHKEDQFTTLTGNQFKQGQWSRWQKGEPNNHKKNEHCVLSNDKGFYWDGNCQAKYAFVCQFTDRCKPSPRFDNIQQSSNIQQQTQSRN